MDDIASINLLRFDAAQATLQEPPDPIPRAADKELQDPMASNPNLRVQQQFVAAVFAGDGDVIRSLCTADFELLEGSGLPFAGVYRGAEGFLTFLGVFNDTFQIEALDPVRSYSSDDPDQMAFEFDLKGVHRASGEAIETSLIELWTFRDGKVATIKPHYFNVPKPAPVGS